MRMRRTVIAIFLMVAVLTLGIGYAALSDSFGIEASANTPGFDTKIDFTAYDIIEGKRNGETISDVETADTANNDYSISVTGLDADNADELTLAVDGFLATAGDFIKVEFTITNTSDFTVTLDTPTVTTNSGTNYSATAVLNATELSAKTGTATLTVTITMDSDVAADADSANGSFTITVNTSDVE
jgi:hypothetical protein